MKMLRSIEIHDLPDGLALVQAVYTLVNQSHDSRLIRESFADMPAPVPYSKAVTFAENKGRHSGKAVIDYVLFNAKIPLVESLALMQKGE